ncbi:hypothetical protein EYF80_044688 [Liparis tanakae]|uniref:Uncharacterized protein n=1 Tax=Liparis tanakae TaxID=230148 RepID=A0A4Z2FV76_9TELE|nr:hypothetical protein EYF80_044688 [Liparis tanakae]
MESKSGARERRGQEARACKISLCHEVHQQVPIRRRRFHLCSHASPRFPHISSRPISRAGPLR